MTALVVVWLVAITLLVAAIWRECDRADRAEAELERRWQESLEQARRDVSGAGNKRERHIP